MKAAKQAGITKCGQELYWKGCCRELGRYIGSSKTRNPTWQESERLTSQILQAEGWRIVYQDTHGPFDIVATDGKRTRLLQIKLRNHVYSKVLARRIAKEVLDSYKKKERLPPAVTLEAWIWYRRNGSWHIEKLCYPD